MNKQRMQDFVKLARRLNRGLVHARAMMKSDSSIEWANVATTQAALRKQAMRQARRYRDL